METILLVLTFILAVFDWVATEKNWHKVRLFSKPATLMALIAWFSAAAGWNGANLWFGLALVFSLLGDVNLMFPDRLFLPGLLSFMLAHVFYIAGFNQGPLPLNLLSLVIAGVVAGAGALIFGRVRVGLVRTPEGRRMRVPVLVYSTVISLMLISAWLCLLRPGWPLDAALAASVGALLFFISDSVLAYNRFVGKTPHSDLLVMGTYHLGQIAIIAGVVLLN